MGPSTLGRHAGRGLFTTIDIAKKHRIVELQGEFTAVFEDMVAACAANHRVMEVRPGLYFIPRRGDLSSLLKDPLVRGHENVRVEYDAAGGKAWLTATASTSAFGELLTHYGLDYWSRSLHKLDEDGISRLMDFCGDELLYTEHWRIFAEHGADSYLEFLEAESWDVAPSAEDLWARSTQNGVLKWNDLGCLATMILIANAGSRIPGDRSRQRGRSHRYGRRGCPRGDGAPHGAASPLGGGGGVPRIRRHPPRGGRLGGNGAVAALYVQVHEHKSAASAGF